MARKKPSASDNRLLSFIERVEKVEDEIELLKVDRSAIYNEAKHLGYDPKIMRAIVAERKKDPAALAEFEAMREIYRAALGMLGGTPLGDAARKRFLDEPRNDPDDQRPDDDDGAGDGGNEGGHEAPSPTVPAPITPEAIEAARREGGQAAGEGRSVTSNPYPAGDPRRAAWDEGWCATAGSDGMDIPKAFRRSKPPKPKRHDESGQGGDE